MHSPSARMYLPSPALRSCLMAGVERDTRGCEMSDAERLNFYPATPLPVISWIFEGDLHMLEACGPDASRSSAPVLPRLSFSGPQTRPLVSWSPGGIHALSVGFYPEALNRLFGKPVASYVDQILPLEAIAPPALLEACQLLFISAGRDPFGVLEKAIQPFLAGMEAEISRPYLGDWVRALATRAAHSSAGRGLRQWQRRIRRWTGQSHRDLLIFVRVEAAFFRRNELADRRIADLAGLAAEVGFADQSHMGRAVRRVTGLSPGRFDERIKGDEAFWYYRLLESSFQEDFKVR